MGRHVLEPVFVGEQLHHAVEAPVIVRGRPGFAAVRMHPVDHHVQVGMWFVAVPHDERLVLGKTGQVEGLVGDLLHDLGRGTFVRMPVD